MMLEQKESDSEGRRQAVKVAVRWVKVKVFLLFPEQSTLNSIPIMSLRQLKPVLWQKC